MKKAYVWFIISICLFGSVFAQKNTWDQVIDVKVDANAFAEMGQKIQNVDVDFCDKVGSKTIDYDYTVWKDRDVCFNLFNGSDRDVIVNLWFVDGMFTNDQWKNRACWTADDVDSFGRYVTWYQTTLVLKKDESKTTHAIISYPKDMLITWSTIQWCLVYSLVSDNTWANPSVWFGVVVRKAKFINLNIKKVPMFDIRYLSIIIIIVLGGLVIYRKRLLSSKWK